MNVESIHCHIDPIPRVSGSGKGRRRNSVAQAVDYILRRGKYTEAALAKKRQKSEKEERLIAWGHANIPAWGISRTGSPRPFFAAADEYERGNGRLGYRWECSVPRDIYAAGRSEELIHLYIDRYLHGHPYVYAIHCTTASDGGPQPHFHSIACERRPEPGQVFRREMFFRRANPHHPEKGGCPKNRELHERGFFRVARKGYADACNQILAEIGSDVRVTEKSLEDRGIHRLPTTHIGPVMAARVARAERLALAGKLRKQDLVTPSPALVRRVETQKKLKLIDDEISKLNQQKEQDAMKLEMENRQRQEAARHKQAADQEVHEIHMRIATDRERQRVLTDEEVARIRAGIARALVGWRVKWRPTQPGEMPAFVARSGPHRIEFDGKEITGHDESEETLARMVEIARAAGKHRVEVSGSPQACRRLAELCAAAGIEVVGLEAGPTPKPMSIAKPAGPTPFDVDNGPTPFNR